MATTSVGTSRSHSTRTNLATAYGEPTTAISRLTTKQLVRPMDVSFAVPETVEAVIVGAS